MDVGLFSIDSDRHYCNRLGFRVQLIYANHRPGSLGLAMRCGVVFDLLTSHHLPKQIRLLLQDIERQMEYKARQSVPEMSASADGRDGSDGKHRRRGRRRRPKDGRCAKSLGRSTACRVTWGRDA